jgi:UDP-glucuronate 4-epimerase
MNVLITGSAGFIGFHLALKLKEKGNFVLGYDNFNSYYDPALKQDRAAILKEKGVLVYKGDIRERESVKRLIEENEISHLVHLAAQAGVRHSITCPDDYIASNLEGFISILESAKDFKDLKIVYASSSSVYGKNKKIPFSTEDLTDSPANLYGATKKANELIAYAYHNLYGMKLIGLRFFTVYGPWGRPDMAYFKFAKNILQNQPIDLFGSGEMKRDFTYIDDIVNGIISALESKISFDIFNLGNSFPIKISYLIDLLEHHLQKKAILNLLPMQKGEVLETFADISKSKELLGFYPTYSFEAGIAQFLQWFRLYYKV